MIKINDFVKNKFAVNWNTILLGWLGFDNILNQLEAKDIIEYAIQMLNDENKNEDLLYLAGLNNQEKDEITTTLKSIANKEKNIDINIETRKWRLLLLKHRIKTLSNDPLSGLIELTDFWAQFNFPKDSPHTIQGVENNISPNEYYTEKNYKRILEKHYNWLKDEQDYIKQ